MHDRNHADVVGVDAIIDGVRKVGDDAAPEGRADEREDGGVFPDELEGLVDRDEELGCNVPGAFGVPLGRLGNFGLGGGSKDDPLHLADVLPQVGENLFPGTPGRGVGLHLGHTAIQLFGELRGERGSLLRREAIPKLLNELEPLLGREVGEVHQGLSHGL